MCGRTLKVVAIETAEKIASALAGGLEAAASIYKEYTEGGGDPMMLRKYSCIGDDVWRTLDDVASGRVDVRVFSLPYRLSKPLRRLPQVTQRKLLDEGVEILSTDNSSIRVPLPELTIDMTRQVIAGGRVRSLSEQAAWKKAQAPQEENAHTLTDYDIKPGKLIVHRPFVFKTKDLIRILGMIGG